MIYRWLFLSLFVRSWGGWLALWIAMARGVKAAAESRERRLAALAYRPARLSPPICSRRRASRPLPRSTSVLLRSRSGRAAFGAALTFAGFAFSIWARFWIAGNWSCDVKLKRDHELIVDGPYGWVRHPIYTGILLMPAGTALAVGEWRGVLAVALAAGAFWRKLQARGGGHAPPVRRDLRPIRGARAGAHSVSGLSQLMPRCAARSRRVRPPAARPQHAGRISTAYS